MKILIIQQKMIGDVLTTSSLFELIKEQYPSAILHYVVNKHTIEVIAHNPYIDAVKIVTQEMETSWFKTIHFSKKLRPENYDVVVDVYGLYSSNLISLFCGAKRKIARKKWYTKFIYTDLITELKKPRTTAGLAIENRLRYIAPLKFKLKTIAPKIYLTKNEKCQAKSFLESHAINLKAPLYMIGVLGSDGTKTYPFLFMAKVLDTIIKTQPNAQLLFNYIPKQLEDAKAIYNLCNTETQKHIYLDVFGKSLRDFMSITHFCNALIGNEGGAINMAKALNIKTFTIFSPWIRKEVWSLFEDHINHVSVHLKDYKPNLFNNKSTKDLKATHLELYNAFEPLLFENQITQFLNNSFSRSS